MAKKVVYLSKTQYETLLADGTIIVDDVTITYSADDMYVVPDDYSYVTESDLEDYVTEVLGGYYTIAQINTRFGSYYTKADVDSMFNNLIGQINELHAHYDGLHAQYEERLQHLEERIDNIG
jgi:hypothetical protein